MGLEHCYARKDLHCIAKQCGLGFIVDGMFTQVDFLDVNLNLETGKYWPYRKPNSTPKYVHTHSNHPPTIIKHLPSSISNRISTLSCSREEFDKAKQPYEQALKKSGYKHSMQFTDMHKIQPAESEGKRKRKRNVLWFNPPFNMNATTKVAQKFLELIDTFFPKGHPLRPLFNRNTVKVSYCCMRNMKALISSHNAKVLTPTPDAEPKPCSCRKKDECPLAGKCLTECIVYQASVATPGKATMSYYGLCEGDFKARFNNHKSSFKNSNQRSKTALSEYIWKLKDKGREYDVKWSIARKAAPYKCGTRKCDICLSEKAVIALADPTTLLNKKAEIVTTCRHRAKFRLDTNKDCMEPS